VEVRNDEGVAIRIGPEPCVAVRKDVDEASVGEGAGQPLSHEIRISGCRLCFESGRQHGQARHREHLVDPAGSKNLACVEAPWAGTGRSQVWPVASCQLVRIGKARSRSQ
jgi:hypothetical protein